MTDHNHEPIGPSGAREQSPIDQSPVSQSTARSGSGRGRSVRREIISWVLTIAFAVGAGLLIRAFLIEPVRIQGPSMYDTLIEGQLTVLDKISYRFADPKHGDVINFYSEMLDERLVKRIIGVPGDTIRIENGQVYRNGALLDEPYATPCLPSDNVPDTLLGEDEYFVMGDNRPRSVDSRSFQVGIIRREHFYGKVVAVVWPFDQIHFGAFTE